jgi:hypothetical protein
MTKTLIYDLFIATTTHLIVTLNTVSLIFAVTSNRGITTLDSVMSIISFLVVYRNVRTKNNG